MTIARTAARILIGLLFLFAGGSDFFINTPPPLPGLAGVFNDVFFKSHWVLFLGTAQVIIGVLMLINRFVPVALIMLAAFLYNSFGFHITMAPEALWAPIIVLGLWFIVAWKYRALFAPIFVANPVIPDQASATRNVSAGAAGAGPSWG